MLTFIGKYGLTCITKEKADRLGKGVDREIVANQSGLSSRYRVVGSIGEDFEKMVDDIKRREFKMSKNDGRSASTWNAGRFFNLNFFHAARLTKDEQEKLEAKDLIFQKQFVDGIPDFPKPLRLSVDLPALNDIKYRLSICTRRTFLITNCKHSCKSIFGCKFGNKKCKACLCDLCTEQINFY